MSAWWPLVAACFHIHGCAHNFWQENCAQASSLGTSPVVFASSGISQVVLNQTLAVGTSVEQSPLTGRPSAQQDPDGSYGAHWTLEVSAVQTLAQGLGYPLPQAWNSLAAMLGSICHASSSCSATRSGVLALPGGSVPMADHSEVAQNTSRAAVAQTQNQTQEAQAAQASQETKRRWRSWPPFWWQGTRQGLRTTQPPWIPFELPAPAPGPKSQPLVAPALSPAEATLRQLTTALKKGEATLTPEVQSILDNVHTQDSKAEIKTLKDAADRLGAARKALQVNRAARLQMQDQWRKFVAQGVTRWQGFAATCKQQEADLAAQITKAVEDLREARQHLDSSRAKAAGPNKVEDGGEISDEDFMATEPQSIGSSMDHFVQNLQALQQQAEETYEQEAKRQKKLQDRQVKLEQHGGDASSAAGLAGAPTALTASMVPFGTPGQ